jgi:hypothetical protein
MIKTTDIVKVLSVVTGGQTLQGSVAVARQALAKALGKSALSDDEIKDLVKEYYDGLEWQKRTLLDLGADEARIDRLQNMAARWKYIAELEASQP